MTKLNVAACSSVWSDRQNIANTYRPDLAPLSLVASVSCPLQRVESTRPTDRLSGVMLHLRLMLLLRIKQPRPLFCGVTLLSVSVCTHFFGCCWLQHTIVYSNTVASQQHEWSTEQRHNKPFRFPFGRQRREQGKDVRLLFRKESNKFTFHNTNHF